MSKPIAYVMWCRWGTIPLRSLDVEDALHEALDYAEKHGLYVLVLEAGEDGREVAACPPTLQSDAVPFLIEFGLGNLDIPASLN
jgi:hypothetical protein